MAQFGVDQLSKVRQSTQIQNYEGFLGLVQLASAEEALLPICNTQHAIL
jgi:hypothetical protein